jgi:hypothetical protein
LNNTSFNGISTLISRIRESMINAGDRFMTEEIIHTLITDGSSKALDSYRQIRQDHPYFRIDPQILDEVSHFLKNAGKTKKADEVGDFTQKLSS